MTHTTHTTRVDCRVLPCVAVVSRVQTQEKNCVGGPQLQRVRTLMYVSSFFVSSPLSCE